MPWFALKKKKKKSGGKLGQEGSEKGREEKQETQTIGARVKNSESKIQ